MQNVNNTEIKKGSIMK